ncbi:MAG: hypothetical protein WCL29_08360 [Pseudomonadota bacterium]
MSTTKIINAPSLANCSFLEMGRQVEELVQGGVHWFHIDIMDGHYVPNICLPVKIVGELKQKYPAIDVDVHLINPALAVAPAGELRYRFYQGR